MIINPTGCRREEKASFTSESTTITPGASSTTVTPTASDGLLTKVTVEGDSNLVANNIKKGVSIFGVTGTYSVSTTTTYNLPGVNFDATSISWNKFATTDDTTYSGWGSYVGCTGSKADTFTYGKLTVVTDSSGNMTSWSSTLGRTTPHYDRVNTVMSKSPYHMHGQWTIGNSALDVSKVYVYSTTYADIDNAIDPTLPNGTYKVNISGWKFFFGFGYIDGTGMAQNFFNAKASATMTVKNGGKNITFSSVTLPSIFSDVKFCVLNMSEDIPTIPTSITIAAQVCEVTSFTPS